MLVLSRKKDEDIKIGDNITIKVVEILKDKVRIGIEAPVDVPVHRLEVYRAIHGQGEPGHGKPANRAGAGDPEENVRRIIP